jgi:hypothetical protein
MSARGENDDHRLFDKLPDALAAVNAIGNGHRAADVGRFELL